MKERSSTDYVGRGAKDLWQTKVITKQFSCLSADLYYSL